MRGVDVLRRGHPVEEVKTQRDPSFFFLLCEVCVYIYTKYSSQSV